jgi:hypothetical protein
MQMPSPFPQTTTPYSALPEATSFAAAAPYNRIIGRIGTVGSFVDDFVTLFDQVLLDRFFHLETGVVAS